MLYVECQFLFWNLENINTLFARSYQLFDRYYDVIYLYSAFFLWIWSTVTNFIDELLRQIHDLKFSIFLNCGITIVEFHLISSLCYSASLRTKHLQWWSTFYFRQYLLTFLVLYPQSWGAVSASLLLISSYSGGFSIWHDIESNLTEQQNAV